MTILLNEQPIQPDLGSDCTLGALLDWVQAHIQTSGSIIVRVEIDGQPLDGPALTGSQNLQIGGRRVGVSTADQKDLAHTMIGKLAALVEYLGQRQHDIARLLEQGQSAQALTKLGDLLNAWQQVQQAFGSLTQMLRMDLDRQMVGDRPAKSLINDFRGHLEEIQQALQNQDMVLLGDVLQYEMDAAIRNWNDLLATTLGIVDGVVELAA